MPSSPQRDKLLKEIEKQLAAMTPLGSKKREANDFFVLGTIEITKKHAVTVDYLIVQGVKEAAVKVVDFLLHDADGGPQVAGLRPREDHEGGEEAIGLGQVEVGRGAGGGLSHEQEGDESAVRRLRSWSARPTCGCRTSTRTFAFTC